jgi:hypothetical protein
MSLKIVKLPVSNLNDIAAMARAFADEVDSGTFGTVRSAILVLDTEDEVHTLHWGECVSVHQAIGILECGKHHLLNMILERG